MKLSILIPSLYSRMGKLSSLLGELERQIERNQCEGDVEVVVEVDKGEMTIGRKRNKLLQQAHGEYIAFVDDDDRISKDYIGLLLKGIESGKDCCSLIGQITTNGRDQKIFKHSIEHNGWYEKEGILYRYVNHLNCVKACIAKKMKFPEINHGEDKSYSDQLQKSKLIKSEHKINSTIYFYDFISDKKKNQ